MLFTLTRKKEPKKECIDRHIDNKTYRHYCWELYNNSSTIVNQLLFIKTKIVRWKIGIVFKSVFMLEAFCNHKELLPLAKVGHHRFGFPAILQPIAIRSTYQHAPATGCDGVPCVDAESPACLDAIVVEQREFTLEFRRLVHLNAISSERKHLVPAFKCVADKRTIKHKATNDRLACYLVTNYVQHN